LLRGVLEHSQMECLEPLRRDGLERITARNLIDQAEGVFERFMIKETLEVLRPGSWQTVPPDAALGLIRELERTLGVLHTMRRDQQCMARRYVML